MLVVIIRIGTVFLNILYALIKLLPTQNKVVMISRQSNEPSMDFLLLKREIKRRYPETKVVLLCHTLDGGLNSSKLTKVRYCFHMLVQMYHLATSRVAILDTYCIPVSLLKHKSTLKVLQIWHSMGTMKKFGYTTVDTSEGTKKSIADAMKMHQNYDIVLASAEAYKDHLAAGFQCDREKIVTAPLPRLDLLVNRPKYEATVRTRIYEAYPQLREKPVILYCPTFRKDESSFTDAVLALRDALDLEHFQLVVKLHPLSKLDLGDQVITAPEFSSFEMLFAADYLISDYSCIVYEAAVRNIPLFFYDFDIDFYKDGRGLAIDYFHELPGITSTEPAVIAKAIADAEGGAYDREALKAFADKYVHPTRHAAKDIVDLIAPFISSQEEAVK